MALASSKLTYSAIANTIGETSKDVARLCKNSNVNPWSKWKPIGITADALTQNILQNNDYGVEWVTASEPQALLNKVQQNGNLGYKYLKPTLGDQYRQGDFRNYEHGAQLPIFSAFYDGQTLEVQREGSTSLMSATSMSTDYTIGYDDIPKFGSLILQHGVLLKSGNDVKIQYDNIKWNECIQFLDKNNILAFEFLKAGDRTFIALPQPIHHINVKEIVHKKVYKCISKLEARYLDESLKSIYVSLNLTGKGSNKYVEVTGGEITNVRINLSTTKDLTTTFVTKKVADSMIIEKDKDYNGKVITSFFLDNISRQNGTFVSLSYDNAVQTQIQIEWFNPNLLQTEDSRHNKNIDEAMITSLLMEENNNNNSNTNTNGE